MLTRSRLGLVSIVVRPRDGQPRNRCSVPSRSKRRFSSPQGLNHPPPSHLNVYSDLDVKLTAYVNILPGSRMCGAVPPLPTSSWSLPLAFIIKAKTILLVRVWLSHNYETWRTTGAVWQHMASKCAVCRAKVPHLAAAMTAIYCTRWRQRNEDSQSSSTINICERTLFHKMF